MIANIKRYAMRNINLKPMAQQTAVQWLLSELQIRLLKIKSEPDGIVRERMINSFLIDAEQAEAIEKEHIAKAWDDGNYQYFCSVRTNEDFDNGYEYYEEQYKSE